MVIDPEMERILEARQNGFQEMGAASKGVRDELKSPTPLKSMLDRSVGQVRMCALPASKRLVRTYRSA